MHYTKSLLISLTLLATAHAGRIQLSKRDDPFWVDAFKGNKPTGDPQQQEQQNAAAGMVADVKLDCGTVKITSNTNKITQCEFMLPTSGMAAGQTFTGTPAAGYFTIAVTGACHDKYQIGAGNRCTGCGDIGEIPNKLDCHGKAGGGKNTVNLCVSGTELVEC